LADEVASVVEGTGNVTVEEPLVTLIDLGVTKLVWPANVVNISMNCRVPVLSE
jgi:hypothetical protein